MQKIAVAEIPVQNIGIAKDNSVGFNEGCCGISALRHIMTLLLYVFLSTFGVSGQAYNAVVVDSVTHMPLPSASVFDRQGNVVGICNSNGRLPYVPDDAYPITVRYLGFKERVVVAASSDTIFLQENLAELPEVVVESRQHKVMHMLAYVREYSTLTTYTDTVFLFREKMVDYMLNPDKKIRFKGWTIPRVLKCKSYYHFTNAQGLDSVSDECSHHFSWSDWMEVVAAPRMASRLRKVKYGMDTVMGKYSPAEVWVRTNDRVTVDVNVLADTTSRKWVPNLSAFFRSRLDFENFRVRFNYGNIVGDSISPMDLTGYSFNIESNGRGHNMFMFNRVNEPFFVSTYAEIYIIDKEFITVKEARKWERRKINTDGIEIYEPMEAPDLQPSIQELVDRVNTVDNDKVRLALTPDSRLARRNVVKQHFGQRVLRLFKTVTGISRIKMQRNLNNRWRDFSKERILKNNNRDEEE